MGGAAVYQNKEATEKTDRVEYSFYTAETLYVPGSFNTQKSKLKYFEGIVWYRKTFDKANIDPNRRYFLYSVFEIENKSGLDYDLGFLEIGVESRAKGKRKSSQRIVKQPLYKHQFPTKVKKGERVGFVYVLSKFSLSNNNRVIVQLQEENGERDLELKIGHRFINDPN